MKKLLMLSLVLILLVTPVVSALDEQSNEFIEIQILANKGLTQYSAKNYTFNCELAKSSILTVLVKQISGYTYLTVLHERNGTWIESGFSKLDTVGNIYNIQFEDDGQFRLRVIRDFEGNSTYSEFFINVIGGTGTYVSGSMDELVERGQWISNLFILYNVGTWIDFQVWLETAARWYNNPAFILTDFLFQVPIFLLMPQVWFIIAIVVILVIWRYRSRIIHTRQERELSHTYGTKQNLILAKRQAEEEQKLHNLNTMALDYALEKYGSGDYLSRAVAYHMGVTDLGAAYPTAYSLAFELGGSLFSSDETRRKRGLEILTALINRHEPVLEKAYVYSDIAACAKAVSAESTDPLAHLIIKDDFMKIHDLAIEAAKNATTELSNKLKITGKSESGLGEEIKKIEKGASKGAERLGKNPYTP